MSITVRRNPFNDTYVFEASINVAFTAEILADTKLDISEIVAQALRADLELQLESAKATMDQVSYAPPKSVIQGEPPKLTAQQLEASDKYYKIDHLYSASAKSPYDYYSLAVPAENANLTSNGSGLREKIVELFGDEVESNVSIDSPLLPCMDAMCFYSTDPEEQHSIIDVVMHLNDYHKWSREQIANWLETLDIDLTYKGGTK